MSMDLISRLGKEKIIEMTNKSNSIEQLCRNLDAGYRYIIVALSKLHLLQQFKEKIKNYKKLHSKQIFQKSLQYKYYDEQKKVFKIDYQKWCQLFFNGKIFLSSHSSMVRNNLILGGFKQNKCQICGISKWNGKQITLQIHHIDGNKKNNKLENLQFLCPNCHSQTDNYGSKNAIKKQKKLSK